MAHNNKYCILRAEKHKSMSTIALSGKHNYREQPTPNADPTRLYNNKHNWCTSTDQLLAAVHKRLPTSRRRDAVLAIEYFIGASNKDSVSDWGAYFQDAVRWLQARHGGANVVATTVHYDETTPHLVAYVVPLVNNKLSAKTFLGGKKTLSDMQTDFYNSVGQRYGLQRGVIGSTRDHTKVGDFYKDVKRLEDNRQLADRYLEDAEKLKKEAKAELEAAQESRKKGYKVGQMAARAQVDKLKDENERLRAEIARLKPARSPQEPRSTPTLTSRPDR